jgi:ubiquinone/menaquinone biosynthesis C-methylase UbiE
MKTRGEKQYINMPSFASRLYDNLTSVKGVNKSFGEISEIVGNLLKQGRLLDVGTGPGRLLYEINKRNPQIDLYGLDISASMLEVAKKNLINIKNVDLRTGNIIHTDYQDDFFDCIVSTGSFYNWDNPVEGIDEIFRILKPGKTAFVFDTHKNYNSELLNHRLKENLKGYNLFRKTLSKYFLRKQLRITYSIPEYEKIFKQTKFKNSYSLQQSEFGNLPIYVRIELIKT